MKFLNEDATIWGIFVGEKGSQLEILNSKAGPFPPKEGSLGWVAIGWPALGSLNIYQGDYNAYAAAYEKCYPFPEYEGQNEKSYSVRRNEAWRFAFEMKAGDVVIAPNSLNGLVLIGMVEGGYMHNYHNDQKFPNNRWIDLTHLRQVRWIRVIEKGNSNYSSLNRIGLLAFSKLTFTPKQLDDLLA